MRNWAIVDHFEFQWAFSDSQRCKAVCVHQNCDFGVRCNANLDRQSAKVSKLDPDHTCAGNAPVARSQASRVDWLLQVVPTVLKVDAKTTSKAIVDAVNLHFGHAIKVQQAQRVRKLILNVSTEQLVADYSKIPKYLRALHKVDT
jgi:hypothetical protein